MNQDPSLVQRARQRSHFLELPDLPHELGVGDAARVDEGHEVAYHNVNLRLEVSRLSHLQRIVRVLIRNDLMDFFFEKSDLMVKVEVFVEAVEVGRAVPLGEVMLINGADVVVQLLHDLGGRRRRLRQSLRGYALVRIGRRSLSHGLQYGNHAT